ncbi:MAG: magnesium/cobalt transporter CorA [Endomicrobiales bacterium]|nr:magnesium/cobalt transporter CorA [Endomicrobiales bacterium]
MLKHFKSSSRMKGLPPGTLIHIGEQKTQQVKMSVMEYNEGHFAEKDIIDINEALSYKKTSNVTWLNVIGLHDTAAISKIGDGYGIHSLVLEDIVNTAQRPKTEDFEEYIYLVLKMLTYDENKQEIDVEQVSFILGRNFIISFQEKEGDVFDVIRDRIRKSKGRIRKMKTDYLIYALLDAIVDNYFIILEKTGDRIEDMDKALAENPTPKILQSIHKLKQDVLFLRKSIWPLREAVNSLVHSESGLINESINMFFRDVYDHTIQVIDTIETYRDMLSGMLDVYLSVVSNKMNEIMKVLTIIATIFIPLTFIAGIYGMNFEYMPELKWKFGYFGIWIVIIVVTVAMILYFRKKKWL